ncbi:hypothetical protein [Aeromonas salmonicida]|uniref:hypothetical protein n=1 Tax=Aeromonas salmonicida TaxID=645 RepID=UPI003D23E5FE
MNIATIVSIDLRNIQEINQIVRWTTAPIDLVDTNGDTYLSFGALLSIGKITVENSIKSSPLTLVLTGLDPSILNTMNAISINRVRVTISRVFFDDNSNTIQSAEIYFKGWGTAPETNVSYQDKNMYVTLSMECYSIFDMDKKQELLRVNNQTHQFYNPTDEMFKYANIDLDDDVLWKK